MLNEVKGPLAMIALRLHCSTWQATFKKVLPHRASSWHPVTGLVMALVVLSTASFAHAFQQVPDSPSPASGTGQVTAQRVVPLGEGDLMWRVSERIAPLPANAERSTSDLGFLIVASGVMLIDDSQNDTQWRLPAGEAVMTMAGDEQLRAALGSEPAHYDELALVNGASVPSADGANVLFASEPFAGPGARHDVDLVQDTLSAGGQLTLPAGAAPTLVFVSAGTVDITTDAGDIVSLAANQAAALAGALTIDASSDGTQVAAAHVGPSVPRLTQAAGTPVPEGRVIDVSGATVSATQSPLNATPAIPAASANADDDGDVLTNAEELALNTDPDVADTDDDGLSDGDEVLVYGTLPLAPDTDGDGILDGDEIARGTDPLVADNESAAATEEGGSGTTDSDGDGLDDTLEADLGTDPFNPDTDDDGLSDGDEYIVYATGLLNPDTDGDGVLDGQEVANGTDPNDPSSF